MNTKARIDHARRYLQAVAANGAFEEFLHPDVLFEELPNRIVPKGARSDLAAMKVGAERGAKLLRSQTYEVKGAIAEGARVVLEVDWTGVLAVGFGSLAPGAALHAKCAMVFEFREGKIYKQRNYDCYEPF